MMDFSIVIKEIYLLIYNILIIPNNIANFSRFEAIIYLFRLSVEMVRINEIIQIKPLEEVSALKIIICG